MTSHILTRFRIRRRPYVAKAICFHWQRGYQWDPGNFGCDMPRTVPGASGGVDKATASKVYATVIAIYKHWLRTILKYNAAYYLITGAMVSFYLTKGLGSRTGFLLLLPLALGIGLALYARDRGAVIRMTEKDVKELKTKLDVEKVPDMGYVLELLQWSSRFFVIVVIGLGVLVLVCFILNLRWFIDSFIHRAA